MSAEGTGHRHLEAARRESEPRFRATFFQAPVGVAHANVEGEWLLLNGSFCELLRYTQTVLRRKTFRIYTHPGDREAAFDARLRLLAGKISSHAVEKRDVHKNGMIV
jgi:PAS domain S-box-containing protein